MPLPLNFETFKEIFNFTTLVEVFSGLMIIIFAIYQALSKLLSNHGIFKKKKEEREQKEKFKRQEEYQDYLEKTAKKLLNSMIEDLKKTNHEQNERLDKLVDSSNDMLRKEITKIYYKYLQHKKIPRYMKEELFILYQDYRRQNGNSFVKEIFEEMKNWEVVSTEEEAKRES